MGKEETFEVKGIILDQRPNEQFVVLVKIGEQETKIIATLSGQIRKFRIKITKGDSVTVVMSPYDLRKGRITYRDKEEKKSQESEKNVTKNS